MTRFTQFRLRYHWQYIQTTRLDSGPVYDIAGIQHYHDDKAYSIWVPIPLAVYSDNDPIQARVPISPAYSTAASDTQSLKKTQPTGSPLQPAMPQKERPPHRPQAAPPHRHQENLILAPGPSWMLLELWSRLMGRTLWSTPETHGALRSKRSHPHALPKTLRT